MTISTLRTVFLGLCLAPLAVTSALASDPDEYTLQPIISGGSSLTTYGSSTTTATTTGASTIYIDPNTASGGQYEPVGNIETYIVPSGSGTDQ